MDETPKAQQPTTNYAEQVESLASARRAQNASATEPEAKQDQSASKNNSEGIELGSWPDWVIVVFTAFLAWLSWRQHKLGKKLAADTADSVSIAKKSADAAVRGAEISEQALVITQRARISFQNTRIVVNTTKDGALRGYSFSAKWLNVGLTEAQNVRMGWGMTVRPPTFTDSLGFEFDRIRNEPPFSISPGTVAVTQPEFFLPLDHYEASYRGELRIFFWSGVIYDDIFEGRFTGSFTHYAHTCMEVIVNSDPAVFTPGDGPFTFKHFDGYVMEQGAYPA